MRKILLSISLLLNVLFLAALIWSVVRYGGFRAVMKKLTHPGVVVNYQNQKEMYAAFPVSPDAIVFFGNSLTEGGNWEEWFHSPMVFNRGIPGDHCEGMRQRLSEALGPAPHAVFLMAGVNDLAYHQPEQVCEKYTTLVNEILDRYPAVHLYLMSILPVNQKAWYVPVDNPAIVQVNQYLRKLAEKLKVPYVNLHEEMLDDTAQLSSELTYDGVHLTTPAYKIWVDKIRPLVEKELAESQSTKLPNSQ